MPKFNLDINGTDQGAAEGYPVWDGATPPNGVYDGKLKIAVIAAIGEKSKNAGKPRVKIGVELAGNTGSKAAFNGFTAWGGVNLIESGIVFVNQWLKSLTDGSDDEFEAIKQAFYEGGLIVDQKKEHIEKIGRWRVNSPNGELPIRITIKNRSFTNPDTKETRTTPGIESFLLRENATSSASGNDDDEPAEEPDIAVDLDNVGEDVFDEDDETVTA